MHKTCFLFIVLMQYITGSIEIKAQADPTEYLNKVKTTLKKEWPANHTINLVFHGHSVPSGYFKTPEVRTLEAYPQQVLKALKAAYPHAVVNVIVTAIGGENSVQGEKRFNKEVLTHRPDILFIDYALNDRKPGLAKAREATEKMIRKALKKNIKVILLTPSPDLRIKLLTPGNELEQFTRQLTVLAQQYHIGLADSFGAFKQQAERGEDLTGYMAQGNHPNKEGHRLIALEILKYFGTTIAE